MELNKLTINDIKKAEFVICAEDVFKKSEIYWTRFASFVGVAQMPLVGNSEKKKGKPTQKRTTSTTKTGHWIYVGLSWPESATDRGPGNQKNLEK